jgi:RsiW-degrading membrane proteinase PrsW (M82 family)
MAAAILPVIVLMWYIRRLDKIEKEPPGFVFSIFLCGAVTVISALILESLGEIILKVFLPQTSVIYQALFNFLVIAGAEEVGKFVALRLRTWKSPEFNYTYDAVVYAVAASLGFAAVENIFYVMEGGLSTALMRALTSIPGHAMFAVFMGLHYGLAKRADACGVQDVRKAELRKALIIPMLLHGFYDFTLSVNATLSVLIFFAFYLAAVITAFLKVKKLSKEDAPI